MLGMKTVSGRTGMERVAVSLQKPLVAIRVRNTVS